MSVQLFIVSQISISPSVVGTQMTVLASNAAGQSYGIIYIWVYALARRASRTLVLSNLNGFAFMNR